MRALLVSNPNATTTRPTLTDVIAGALSAEMDLHVEHTKRRDHAGYLAAGAEHEGYDAIFALGGDGTVNEVVQGISGTSVKLGVIPGGSTNVWARTLGLPNDAVDATAALLARIRKDAHREVNLGRITVTGADAEGDDLQRLFAFNAGFGFDAEVVRLVEQRYRLKHAVRQASFLYCGVLAYLTRYDRESAITVQVDGGAPSVVLRTAICCNSSPYTFLGRLPAQLAPDASLDGGLDLVGVTSLALPGLIRVARTALRAPAEGRRRRRTVADLRFVRLWHDRAEFILTSDRPLPVQVDGDYLGDTTEVRLNHEPAGLTVIA